MESITQVNNKNINITEANLEQIILQLQREIDINFVNYTIRNANDKMLGFLAEYFKLEIRTIDQKILCFFIKAISSCNLAKAAMVKELRSFEKETYFYSVIKKQMEIPGQKPWSPRCLTVLEDIIVFEDLNAFQYKLRNKFQRFDVLHTLQALKTLARFHASNLLYEQRRLTELKLKTYSITDDFPILAKRTGYIVTSAWFQECMKGALEAIKTYVKYDHKTMARIESCWADVWAEAVSINPGKRRMVICHRDLWNNNILFHYRRVGDDKYEPDDCVFVDFQTYEYDAPASDVMILLYCNLEPRMREVNLRMFLDYYYNELATIVRNNEYSLENIISKVELLESAEEYRKFGLIACSCLMPQFWLDDDLTTNIFSDTNQFNDILCHNKAAFIKTMMQKNSNYKETVLEIFKEIVERYCV